MMALLLPAKSDNLSVGACEIVSSAPNHSRSSCGLPEGESSLMIEKEINSIKSSNENLDE